MDGMKLPTTESLTASVLTGDPCGIRSVSCLKKMVNGFLLEYTL